MRRGIGAIVITGVVLVGATVIVANPVHVPQSDVRVPPVELSAGSAAPGSMLDRAFLDAIAQQPTDSAPVSVVKRMLAELAANAALLGGKAVEEVVDAHTAIAAAPAPAAVSLAAAPVAMVPPGLLGAIGPANLPSRPAVVPDIDPGLRQALTSLAADVGYVGGQIVVAALATGALVASEPRLIVDAVAALAAGDLHTAAVTAITAVSAPVVAPLIVADAVNTVVRNRLVDVPPARAQEQASVRPTATASGVRRHAAAALPSAGPAAASPNGATDLRDGNKTSPRSAQLQAKAGAAIRSARQSADRFGDAVRTALGPHATADAATSTGN